MKRGRKPAGIDFKKVLEQTTQELAAKKKQLVAAERALAKARKNHEELVSEVSRLDMAERSVKAIVEGTEPPVQIKYVYNYPTWVWHPSYYTITTPSIIPPCPTYTIGDGVPWQSQLGTYTNTPSLPKSVISNGNYGSITCSTSTLSAGSSTMGCDFTSTAPSSTLHLTSSGETFTVDISTNASFEESE